MSDSRYAKAPECPICRIRMWRREGKYGLFWQCPNWRGCGQTRSISKAAQTATRRKWKAQAERDERLRAFENGEIEPAQERPR